MNASKFAKHLLGELPALTAQGVIDAPVAESLRAHYAPQIKPSNAGAIGIIIGAILGATLIGAGIILLLAHNWEELSRPVRAGVSILPLLASIAAGAFTLLKRENSAAWREGSGIFYFLSIGASVALVSQTYHLYSDTEAFLLTWLLLSIPLFYLVGAGTACVGSLVLCVCYNGIVNDWNQPLRISPFLFFAATLPFFVWQVWRKPDNKITNTYLAIGVAIAPVILMITNLQTFKDYPLYLRLAFAVLFAIYYLIACRFVKNTGFWNHAFRVIGCAGIACTSVILTFAAEKHGNDDRFECGSAWWVFGVVLALNLAVVFPLRKYAVNRVAAFFPSAVAFCATPAASSVSEAGTWMTLYVFILGIATLIRGVKRDSLLSINEGTLLVAALVACRFFDENYGFVLRGLAFIGIGIAFLGVNFRVLKMRKNKKEALA